MQTNLNDLDFFAYVIVCCLNHRFKDNTQGISEEDYLKFFHFLSNINDVDTALTFYHIAGASIDQSMF